MENGKICIVDNLKFGVGFGSTEFHVLRADKDILSKYLYFFVSQDYFRKKAEKFMTGAVGQRRVPASYFIDVEIPIPPLEEQNLVVKKIEDSFSRIDAVISGIKKSQGLMESYKQSVFSHAFSGKLTNSDFDSWEIKRLGDIAITSSGGTPSRKNFLFWEKGNICLVKSGELLDWYISDSEEKITHEALNNSSVKLIKKDAILVAMYGATIGRLGILNIESTTNQAICAIENKKNPEFVVKFLYYYLFSIRKKMTNDSFGGAQKNISQTYVKNLEIPLPDLPTQTQIVTEIEKHFAAADNALALINQSLEKAETLKQSILQKAFSGELVKDSHE